MKLRNKIMVPVLAGAIIFSGYGILKYKKIEDENVRLKNELEKNKNSNNIKVSYTTTVDEIKEINSSNIDLVLYESDCTNYETILDDNTLFGINANIKTKFKYDVVINLSKAKVDKNGNKLSNNNFKEQALNYFNSKYNNYSEYLTIINNALDNYLILERYFNY